MYTIKKFHRFILDRVLTLQRPQTSTVYFRFKKGIPIHTANRLQWRSIILLNYNFKMEYISSKNKWDTQMICRD